MARVVLKYRYRQLEQSAICRSLQLPVHLEFITPIIIQSPHTRQSLHFRASSLDARYRVRVRNEPHYRHL